MPSELIEGAFVQRQSLAERLVDLFEQSARRESKHNVLLVGPRGIGKSHLVSLVYHRLKAKGDLGNKLCLAYLREDEWGINSFLDLLLRTLRAAFDEAGLEIPEVIKDLSELSKAQAEDIVWRSLRDMLGKRTLVLIIENIDAVFEKIEEQGQRQWRALMQTTPRWAILGTTPALFSAISRQVSPFYGFFEVIHLQPLSLNDAVGLLQKLARLNHDEKTASFLDTPVGRARVRAVRHLAGGNHRIFVLFYDFLSQSGSEHFVTPLLRTIDALTPYYQSQMARLSPQQQKIVNFLCEYQKPSTVTAIAKNCLTTHQTAASQLKQLLNHRYVRVDRIGRESFYELTEPLLRICVEAKAHRERPLDLLVDFIRYWFSREELERKLSASRQRDYEKTYLSAALKEYDHHDAHVHLSPEIASLCAALTLRRDTAEQLRAHAQELAELSKIAEDWHHYTRAMTWLGKAAETIPILEEIADRDPDNVNILRSLASAYSNAGSMARAQELLDRAIDLNPHEGILFLDKGLQLCKMKKEEEALEAFEQAQSFDPGLKPVVASNKARIFMRAKRFQSAREAVAPFLSKGSIIPEIFYFHGVAYASEGNFGEALKYLVKATRAFESDSGAWGSMGAVLGEMGRHKEALEAMDRSLALDPKQNWLSYRHCEALLETHQYANALETATPEDLSHAIFHKLLKLANSRPKQGYLQQKLVDLMESNGAKAWQDAVLGGLTELTSFAAEHFKEEADLKQLKVWNSALHELFGNRKRFSLLLKLFDVLTRVKTLNDKKALLELPREQRLLLTGESEDESFSTPKR